MSIPTNRTETVHPIKGTTRRFGIADAAAVLVIALIAVRVLRFGTTSGIAYLLLLVALWLGLRAELFSGAASARTSLRRLSGHFRTFWNSLAASLPARWAIVLVPVLLAAFLRVHRLGMPVPIIHDEWSFVFAGKTFASGHLANPTPPLWHHFETFHELMVPSYVSRYPPAQGMALALGILATGNPVAGVWLVALLALGAVYLLLRAFLPARWALVGTLLLACNRLFCQWSMDFLGADLALLGGALFTLGLHGLLASRLRHAGYALSTVAGIALLANTRPYEGLLLIVFLLGATGWRWLSLRKRGIADLAALVAPASLPTRNSERRSRWVMNSIGPTAGILAAGIVLVGAAFALYNHATTGSYTNMPHREYTRQYESNPIFIWDRKVHPHTFNNVPMKQSDDYLLGLVQSGRGSPKKFVSSRYSGFASLLLEEADDPLLLLGLAVAGFVGLRRRIPGELGGYLVVTLLGAGMISLSAYVAVRYTAPFVPLIVLLSVYGLRVFASRLRFLVPRGGDLFLLSLLPLIVLPQFVLLARPHADEAAPEIIRGRDAVEAQLKREGGRHLVFVRYGPDHSYHMEWVYNEPDLVNAPVIFARELSPAENEELIRRFPDRKVWLAEPDKDPNTVVPYAAAPPPPAAPSDSQ